MTSASSPQMHGDQPGEPGNMRPTDGQGLEIALGSSALPVSYLSSMLRVVQAALREVARSSEDTHKPFSQQLQPVLLVSTHVAEGNLVLRFAFADPLDSTPMSGLSAQVFAAFLKRFAEFLKGLPQRGLWGTSVGGVQRQQHESEVARRMDELRLELRHFPKVRLSANQHTILFEDDRMEID